MNDYIGINWLEIEQTLVAVTAQRLVELTCPYCQGECSPYCYSYGRWKRASVIELLNGRALSSILKEARGELLPKKYRYKTLKDYIKKGIALGYIKENEFERWVYEDE